jgi:flagellar capping protein FliD
MDAGTMKDYIDDLIQQVNQLEAQFHKLNEVIAELQRQRDEWRKLYEEAVRD